MSEWVNIGIAYPEYHTDVLLTDGEIVGFGHLVKTKTGKHWQSHQNLGWITHWMPLPSLPE